MRGVYSAADHYLVFAKVREMLAVSKQAARKFDGERSNLWKLNELDVRKQYQIKYSNKFTVSENFSYNVDIYRAWETSKKYQSLS